MPWLVTVFLLSAASLRVSAINRPVYKIVLNQKGYAQFLQYDIETPPLREFTFCTWFRIYDLFGDQSIFTYVANSNNRVIRLWLDSGGRQMKVSIDGKVQASSTVDIMKNVWRHVCLSYQSDYGAWALYLDARLITCEVAQSLQGFVLPGGGSVIVGYGTNDHGGQNGLEGEIFGANMLLMSTIEKNYTLRTNPMYEQKTFKRNRVKKGNTENVQYVVLKDLQTGEVKNKFKAFKAPVNRTRNFIKVTTPHSVVEHSVGVHLASNNSQLDKSIEREIFDFPSTTDITANLWNFNQYDFSEKFLRPQNIIISPTPKNIVMLSEYETPPPRPTQKYFGNSVKDLASETHKLTPQSTEPQKTMNTVKFKGEIPLYETPPPVDKSNTVYGQWTSSKFAGRVLDHLKNIQHYSKDQKKVPQTIPLNKHSDSFPYASEFKLTKLRPPYQFQRKHLVERRYDGNKRSPQINVQILEDDIRNSILKSHAQTQLKHVLITHRGFAKQPTQHRFYRNVVNQDANDEDNAESDEYSIKPKPFTLNKNNAKNHDANSNLDEKSNNLLGKLPFLRSMEYLAEDSDINDSSDKKSNMYTRSLSNRNKWHNVKSYSNDYTPRKINIDLENNEGQLKEKIAEANRKHPSIRLKYKHEQRKVMPQEDESILRARKLALHVSNFSDYSTDSISILKYNHGYLPGQKFKAANAKLSDKLSKMITSSVKYGAHNNFNKHIKIGNALNERHVIGVNEEQKKRSFVGGDDSVPDINRYRSDIDFEHLTDVPSSLHPRVCKNVELYDRVLYVQPDESIDMTHILSPVKAKNVGIEFVMQNYKKCSLEESYLHKNAMLFIDWSKTPVRLFGGAYPVRTTDLCGFF